MPGYAFPKTARLNHPREFKQVFASGQRRTDACFTVITLANEAGRPRLGLVVARKVLKRAVDRNRVKRAIRESFRANQPLLPKQDFVVMVRAPAGKQPGQALRQSLTQHWQKVIDTCRH